MSAPSTHPNSTLAKLAGSEKIEFEREGKTFTLKPLTMRQWGEIELWAKKQPLEVAKSQMEYAPTDDEKMRIWKEALEVSNAMDMTSDNFRLYMLSFQGLNELFYLSLVRSHPEMTREMASDLMDLELIQNFQVDFMELNKTIFGDPSEGAGVSENPEDLMGNGSPRTKKSSP